MREYGIDDGDLIVVDSAIQARHAHIVVAMMERESTVKLLHCAWNAGRLQADNTAYPDITSKRTRRWRRGPAGPASSLGGLHLSCARRQPAAVHRQEREPTLARADPPAQPGRGTKEYPLRRIPAPSTHVRQHHHLQ